ncbi:4-(cytidine 5'-diphospho)-2-C-methyl-D-erythritol kinase [Bifidobacterium sp. CP2]|uniref:4-(cytidine 5'-diphospho)-2-C-methyl-D-erythritol kinase n=1 Tax=Bifidobacterium sp. CP2 TaxID=2809025 RepID=UPI001BDCD9EE|nr:4-(cytidine 5'-diphospho)-2-C-methyl-D-erythritol kinase [Bifidobacterium sp. CP2]MBT1181810.1 4-(cytidine 5'-diphospho)-2-C-methyl-D-erythritol kinase [Bifidobacterium sp. CP2]
MTSAVASPANLAAANGPLGTAGTADAPRGRRNHDALPVSVSVDCPAKTNLTLEVGPAHEQWGGRHELDTIYCALGLTDTVTAGAKPAGSGFSLDLAGRHLGDLASGAADMRRNHAVLALFAMAEEAGRTPDVALSIDKRIPVGAGLAGGSADAAATILALNVLWGLDWPVARLRKVAATLGADMPFCVAGGYARGTGYGEIITPIEEGSDMDRALRAEGYCGGVLVGAYQAQLSTPKVYAAFDRVGAGDGHRNHLQRAAVELHPRSGTAVDEALRAGARHAFVSGSGPSVVAFVPTEQVRERVAETWRRSGAVDRIIAAEAPAKPLIRPHYASMDSAGSVTVAR